MSTDDAQTSGGQTNGGPCADCDLHAIEDLACSAKRFAQQAAVATESSARLTGYQASFATARADYQAARDAVQADLSATKRKLHDVIEDLECKLDDRDEECVKDAIDKVVAAIRECSGEPGCCVGDGDFEGPGDDETATQLAGRIDEYRREVAAAEKCFTDLIAETTAIAGRVADLKAEVDAIAGETHSESEDKDWVRLYARALIVRWKLRWRQLWKGFQTVNDYMDCLCKALQRALAGWEVIALLEGRKAELDCQDEAAAAACAKKWSDMIGEVMAEYVRCCPPEDNDDDDCGCGDPEHKHRHHRDDDHSGGESAA
jgi:hypothetical protein